MMATDFCAGFATILLTFRSFPRDRHLWPDSPDRPCCGQPNTDLFSGQLQKLLAERSHAECARLIWQLTWHTLAVKRPHKKPRHGRGFSRLMRSVSLTGGCRNRMALTVVGPVLLL